MRTVYLVRHGATAMNVDDRERSWCTVPLDDAGRKEARRVGRELAGLGIRSLASSDLTRARQSAIIIGDVIGIEPVFVPQLRTWNLGELTGQPKARAEPQVARLVRFAPDRTPAGGESFNTFRARVFAGLADTTARHPGKLAIVLHSRIERLLAAWRAAGSRPGHNIDVDVFLKTGEAPGHVEPCRIDVSALKLFHLEAEFSEAKRTGDRCGACKAYGGVNRCTKVLPPMDADDWCNVGIARRGGHWFSGADRKD